jgi:AraC-like DNA-binding protein
VPNITVSEAIAFLKEVDSTEIQDEIKILEEEINQIQTQANKLISEKKNLIHQIKKLSGASFTKQQSAHTDGSTRGRSVLLLTEVLEKSGHLSLNDLSSQVGKNKHTVYQCLRSHQDIFLQDEQGRWMLKNKQKNENTNKSLSYAGFTNQLKQVIDYMKNHSQEKIKVSTLSDHLKIPVLKLRDILQDQTTFKYNRKQHTWELVNQGS